MSVLRRFLIIDSDAGARFFVSRTLLRYFPQAVVQECQDLDTAVELVRSLPLGQHGTVVIAHQTVQADGRQLIKALRTAHASVPVVWTDEPDQSKWAESVGATRFLDRKAWLLIGNTVEDLV
jgi:DNA-binding NarL/FixJ family response regulator